MYTAEQQRVIDQIRKEMSRRKWNSTDLAAAAGISVDTVRDIVNGKRWPQAATLAKLEEGFDWVPGSFFYAEESEPVPASTNDVGASGDSGTELLMHLPPAALEGLTEMEREEAVTAGRMAILRALREIRGK